MIDETIKLSLQGCRTIYFVYKECLQYSKGMFGTKVASTKSSYFKPKKYDTFFNHWWLYVLLAPKGVNQNNLSYSVLYQLRQFPGTAAIGIDPTAHQKYRLMVSEVVLIDYKHFTKSTTQKIFCDDNSMVPSIISQNFDVT